METIKNLEKFSWAGNYLEYTNLRKKGLKKQSQAYLTEFIEVFKKQNVSERRNFVDSVYSIAYLTSDYSTFLPMNLYKEAIQPEIETWIKEEPDNPIPNKWSYDLNNNKKAILLNPNDQIAIENFANKIINKISLNQHEVTMGLPYDGNPQEDISLIEFAEGVLPNYQNDGKKESFTESLRNLKVTALDFLKRN